MALVITEEQSMLKNSAKEFLAERAPVAALRKLRDSRDEKGYDPQVWKEMVEMGWASLTIPEAYGGLDFGYTGLGQILEESGKTLTASPLVATVLVGTTILNEGANVMQKEQLLPAIADGQLLLAYAGEEVAKHRPFFVETTYEETADGYILNGQKVNVLDGHIADKLIVSAKKDGEFNLFLVDANTTGVTIERVVMMDSRNMAKVKLNNVKISLENRIGSDGSGKETLKKALDIARIGLAAEMIGTMQEAFARTVSYLKERIQFDVPIGSFQSLQHRAAHMFCEIENCKSIVLTALQAIDNQSDKLPVLACLAKAKVGETIHLVSNEAIQMYGGIGMTDDEEIGFFLKRARVAQQTFGDWNFHLNKYALMNGY